VNWNKRCLGEAREHVRVAPIVRIKMSISINRNSIMNKNLHLLLHLQQLRFLASDTCSTVVAVVAPTSVQSVLVAMRNVVVVEEHEVVEARRCEVAGRAQSPSRARPRRTHRRRVRRRQQRKPKHFKVLDIDCLMANQCDFHCAVRQARRAASPRRSRAVLAALKPSRRATCSLFRRVCVCAACASRRLERCCSALAPP
jgi:hypothetical protein